MTQEFILPLPTLRFYSYQPKHLLNPNKLQELVLASDTLSSCSLGIESLVDNYNSVLSTTINLFTLVCTHLEHPSHRAHWEDGLVVPRVELELGRDLFLYVLLDFGMFSLLNKPFSFNLLLSPCVSNKPRRCGGRVKGGRIQPSFNITQRPVGAITPVVDETCCRCTIENQLLVQEHALEEKDAGMTSKKTSWMSTTSTSVRAKGFTSLSSIT
nr:PREDICTED: uncharacterized protein LOC106703292 [Latimeria chalumnae]|eukprot:XP_014343319.1 PREDICTED: uncharacterized protein LOC106703292 [Latimeria chalumnae]